MKTSILLRSFIELIFICLFMGWETSPVFSQAFWPPELGRPYPDMELVDQVGEKVRISDFKGSVIFIEYVGMDCPACQAFAGAHEKGSFGRVNPQGGLESIEKYVPMYAKGITLEDERIVFIQVLLYDIGRKGAPGLKDIQQWAVHFDMNRAQNEIVLQGKQELIGPASFKLIPGFQLIDKDLIVRSDSTGHHPRDNLYTQLIPMIPELLKE